MGARIVNNDFSDTYLYYAVGVNGFPNTQFSMTWRVRLETIRASYQCYTCVASTTFGGGNEYWTASDFNTPAVPSIGSDDGHTLHASAKVPGLQQWRRMAFQRLDVGDGTYEQRWWFDLDNGENYVVQRNNINGIVYEASARFCLGNVPYTTNEGCDCTLQDVKVWSIPKTIADLSQESVSGQIVLPNGTTNLWGQWPLRSDGNDISGNGRHLSSAVSGGSISYDGVLGPGFAVVRTMDLSKFPPMR